MVFALSAFPDAPETRLNPTVKQIVDLISEQRIKAILEKLEGFGTRYVLSAQDDPIHGIGAAKRWIHDELKRYSARLEVSYQNFTVKKGARQGQIVRDVELSNIVAVLPGTIHKDRYVLVTAHYDSLALIRKPFTGEEQNIAESVRRGMDESEARALLKIMPPENDLGPLDFEATAAQPIAPGVTDDGSGTAAVMELARVMSQFQFDKTIVFVTFAAEEIGLSGSQIYADMAKQTGMQIEAVLNNDIIGSDVAGNGHSATNVLRLFAAGPEDSPTRELGRYMKQIAERFVPSMQVQMVFRQDRFLRGGDHTPFLNQSFPAVRLTTASENYKNQHSTTDTLANTSVPYTTRVARMNAAVLAGLALAPAPPVLNWIYSSGPNKGGRLPLLTRGKSNYDAVLHWLPNAEPDLAGYAVLMRSTTSPVWERETWVGKVTSYTMPDVSIDNLRRPGMEEKHSPSLTVFCRETGVQFTNQLLLPELTEFRSQWKDGSIAGGKKLERLRAFGRFLVDRGWWKENFALKLKRPKVTGGPTLPYTTTEMSALLSACSQFTDFRGQPDQENARRLRAFILLLRYSGLRISDAASCPVDRLTGNRIFIYTQKTGVPVYIPLPPFVMDALNACPRKSERYWFWTGTGSKDTLAGNWRRTFRRLCEIAGVRGGHPHRFRDTLAVELLLQGVPIERVSVLLGHSSVRVTERHYSPWVKARQEQLEADVTRTWGNDPIAQAEMLRSDTEPMVETALPGDLAQRMAATPQRHKRGYAPN